MSRVGKKSIAIDAAKVSVKIADKNIIVEGPKGKLISPIVSPHLDIEISNSQIQVKCHQEQFVAMHGLQRALISNLVQGVTEGFVKQLSLVGVGYKAQMVKGVLQLKLGYSHPIFYQVPEGIEITTPTNVSVVVSGCDKQKVGQVAAIIRSYRPAEPYKGKGVMYLGEVLYRKDSKKKK